MLNKQLIYLILGLAFVIAIPIILNVFIFDSEPTDSNSDDEKKLYWGIDSANSAGKDVYQCVKDNFGQPEVWGRYIGDKEDVSTGLSSDEAKFLHEKDIRILVIYNHFTDATGYDHGVEEAKQAIDLAQKLEIPDGVAIFGDIEPKFPIDSAFMQGWSDTLTESAYKPGLYGVFDKGSAIVKAYNATESKTKENTVIWTAYPQEKITTKENAPEYKPQGPDDALLYGWQYAIESDKCTIDTNLFKNEMLDYLW
ncbi:glycoside hydrolase domain-containing protein [Virgibacillus sp. FSP13]